MHRTAIIRTSVLPLLFPAYDVHTNRIFIRSDNNNNLLLSFARYRSEDRGGDGTAIRVRPDVDRRQHVHNAYVRRALNGREHRRARTP